MIDGLAESLTTTGAEPARRHPTAHVALWTALALSSTTWGCTSYEPASDTLELTGLSVMPESGSWACLQAGTLAPPRPVFSDTADRVVYSVQIVDLSTGQIYPDASVRACGVTDINCESPVTSMLSVDAEGWVDLPLFRNFTGYLEVRSADAVPLIFYLSEPIQESTVEYPLALVSLASLGPLVQLLGVPFEPDSGVLAVRAFDCQGSPASGVSLSTESDGATWYFVDGLPTRMSAVTGADGLAGIVNVDPGLAVVELAAQNGVSIDGPQSVVMRPGWMSAIFVRPAAGVRAPE
jgi:hypothetical protein